MEMDLFVDRVTIPILHVVAPLNVNDPSVYRIRTFTPFNPSHLAIYIKMSDLGTLDPESDRPSDRYTVCNNAIGRTLLKAQANVTGVPTISLRQAEELYKRLKRSRLPDPEIPENMVSGTFTNNGTTVHFKQTDIAEIGQAFPQVDWTRIDANGGRSYGGGMKCLELKDENIDLGPDLLEMSYYIGPDGTGYEELKPGGRRFIQLSQTHSEDQANRDTLIPPSYDVVPISFDPPMRIYNGPKSDTCDHGEAESSGLMPFTDGDWQGVRSPDQQVGYATLKDGSLGAHTREAPEIGWGGKRRIHGKGIMEHLASVGYEGGWEPLVELPADYDTTVPLSSTTGFVGAGCASLQWV
jgi:hypothetical protein